MSKQNMQELGHSPTVFHHVGEIDLGSNPSNRFAEANYTVFLINGSDRIFVMGCYNYDPNGNNNWFPIPHTGRTCSDDCDTCHKNQQWQPIMMVDCDESFDLTLATEPDANGNAYGARWQITPDCQYSGGSLCTA